MNDSIFICPNCHDPLRSEGRALTCPKGHSFDLAREGYVNLLTGKAPGPLQGDSAAMVQARRAFLNRGLYRPLVVALAAAVEARNPRVVADFGCGEGYYAGQLMSWPALAVARFCGTDISKPAVAAAAKHYPGGQFAVADTNRFIPLPAASVDVGLCVFAPRNPAEFARTIRPGGWLIVAIPGPGHIAQARERFGLIGIENDKAAKIQSQMTSFELVKTQTVGFEITLDGPALRDLIGMTPNARHTTPETQEAIVAADKLKTSAEFELLSFRRPT